VVEPKGRRVVSEAGGTYLPEATQHSKQGKKTYSWNNLCGSPISCTSGKPDAGIFFPVCWPYKIQTVKNKDWK
jgi:hypothetical protein